MSQRRKTNKNVVIIMLIILLLALAVGYAAFSDILTISGTANAKGTFDLEFQNAEIVKLVGAKEEGTTAEISQDKNTLTVNVADLAYPGAGVEFSVDIVNVGTIPAEVNAVNATNITGSKHIKVTGLESITTNHETIGAGDKCNIHFTVEWPKEMTNQIAENEIATFELSIEYTQATGEDFDGKSSHTDGENSGESGLPEYTIPTGLTAIYGDTLADVELPEGFKFQDSLETSVGNAGINQFKVTYTSADNNVITDIEVSIVVEKAIPEYTIPTGLTAMYGAKLADIKLPEGFKFQDPLETSVGNEKVKQFTVMYTPTDTNNYKEVTDIKISINVTFPTLVSQIAGADYGKAINYKATVQGQEVSNWKVFYNDGNNVYIILDDYLPANLVPASAGLDTNSTKKPYSVWSGTDRTTLLSGLTTQSHWSEFTNGATGATATGTPTYEEFVASWNANPAVNGRTLKEETLYYGSNNISDPTNLYVPHTAVASSCNGYWLASPYAGNSSIVWLVNYDSEVSRSTYTYESCGVRPVVCLPSDITGSVGDTVEI